MSENSYSFAEIRRIEREAARLRAQALRAGVTAIIAFFLRAKRAPAAKVIGQTA